jgi:hypothetical protein
MSTHRLTPTALLAVALLCGFAAGCNTTAMLHPVPVATNLSAEKNRHIVLDSLASRRWMVESEQPDAVVASFSRRQHRARVRISWTQNAIQIAYLDSENLKCEVAEGGGCVTIHRAYNRWVSNLYQDIAAHVAAGR